MENLASLILANTGRRSLKTIIAIRRASNASLSYSYISKSIGIKSRSYVSEAVNGKKPLSAKHISPIVDLLDLAPDESSLLKNKLLLEMGDLNSQEQERIQSEIRNIEKLFALKRFNFQGIDNLNVILILSVVLHLFEGHRASRREILDLFPRDRFMEIEKGINDLVTLGLFVKENDSYVFSKELNDISHLYTRSTRAVELTYLRSSMKEAIDHVHNYKNDSDSSVFYSGIVATDMEEFKAALGSIKQNIRGIQSQMISPKNGDSLIRFNIQLYPIVHKTASDQRRPSV